jgi:HK97 family phage portal protein
MGLLAERFEQRFDPGWLTRDDDPDPGNLSTAGVRVNARAALGLSTVWRCVDLLSSAVSQSPKDIVLKLGGQSYLQHRDLPNWLTTPNPADPTFTVNDYFAQVALSLLFDGNYFVHVFPYVLDPQVLTVLDPTHVRVKPGPIYELLGPTGQVTRTLGPMEMLHGTWIRGAGELRGMSPLETLRRGIGSAIAAEDFGARFFGQGAALSFGVEVPGEMTKEKKDELRDQLRRKHNGLSNSHAIGVLTAGAKFVPGLAPTPEQAQMLATRQFSVEDLCRPFGVPPGMVGSQQPGASSYASADVFREIFAERSVVPLAVRIETQHNRLLSVPPSVNDPHATVQFKFNLDGIARGNIKQRYDAYLAGIQGGILKPREAREKEDLPPLADGSDDKLYMQAQMVPLDKLGLVPPIAPAVPQPRSGGDSPPLGVSS